MYDKNFHFKLLQNFVSLQAKHKNTNEEGRTKIKNSIIAL